MASQRNFGTTVLHSDSVPAHPFQTAQESWETPSPTRTQGHFPPVQRGDGPVLTAESHHTWGCCFLESITKSCHLRPTAQGSPWSTSAPEPFGQLKCRGDVQALLHFTAGSHQKPSLCMGKSHPKAPVPLCSHLNVTSMIYN